MDKKNNFRIRMVFCSIWSLILAVLTEIVFGLVIYEISIHLGRIQGKKEPPKTSNMRGPGFYDKMVDTVIRPLNVESIIVISFIFILVAILLFTMYFFLFTRKLQSDINEIMQGIHSITEIEGGKKIHIDREDEIGRIARQINSMMDEIQKLIDSERENEQQKKDLIASVAHDLRTPITSVTGYLELAKQKEKYDDEKRYEFVCIAANKAHRLANLTEDLFSYTKLASGEITVKKSDIDVVQLVYQMIEEFYPLFDEARLECEVKTNVSTCILQIDGELIARAVQNLFSNAVKYGKDGKRILVHMEQGVEMLRLSVTNYGKLIPKDQLEMVFERFYRVENSRSTQTGGSGLGLNIVREIVQLHGGKVEAESGKNGTKFVMYLPLNKEVKGDNSK